MKEKLLFKCQELNYVFNQANLAVMKNPSSLNENLVKIKDSLFEVITFYDAFKVSLKSYELQYKRLVNSWDDFVNCIKKYQNYNLTHDMQNELGSKLQKVKEENERLIECIVAGGN